MKNKKILGTKSTVDHGIQFKSTLEKIIYNCFLKHGLKLKYESKKFTLWNGYYPTVLFYKGHKRTVNAEMSKLMDTTYTPDFILKHNGYTIIIEAKGFPNDVFPLKFKMFRKTMERKRDKHKILIFELFNKAQAEEAINIIYNLK